MCYKTRKNPLKPGGFCVKLVNSTELFSSGLTFKFSSNYYFGYFSFFVIFSNCTNIFFFFLFLTIASFLPPLWGIEPWTSPLGDARNYPRPQGLASNCTNIKELKSLKVICPSKKVISLLTFPRSVAANCEENTKS